MVFKVWLGIAFEAGSIYKECLEQWLSWARPLHLPDIWEERDRYYNVRLPKRAFWADTNQTEKLDPSFNNQDNGDDLTFKHLSGAFYILFGALFCSLVVFCQELIYFYWDRNCFASFVKCKS